MFYCHTRLQLGFWIQAELWRARVGYISWKNIYVAAAPIYVAAAPIYVAAAPIYVAAAPIYVAAAQHHIDFVLYSEEQQQPIMDFENGVIVKIYKS